MRAGARKNAREVDAVGGDAVGGYVVRGKWKGVGVSVLSISVARNGTGPHQLPRGTPT